MILKAETVRARLASGDCVIRSGEMVDVAGLTPEELARCRFQNESGFVFNVSEAEKQTPRPKREKRHKKREKRVEQEEQQESVVAPTVEVIASAAPDQALAAISLPDAGIPSVKALVGAAPADLKSVLPDAANTNGMTVVLAGIAVLGGGAAWKFYSSYSKQKHEQAMARIENEKRDHGKCEASRAALELKVTDIQSQLADSIRKLEEVARLLEEQRQKTATQFSVDPDELEERIEAMEKALKKNRRKT